MEAREHEPTDVQPALDDWALARGFGSAVGLAAAAVAILPALIASSAAATYRPDVLALQRSLITLRDGLGGPWIDPLVGQLVAMVLATYAAALLGLLAALCFCWYAGYVTGETTGNLDAAGRAGRRVAWIAWGAWLIVALLTVALLHQDGTLSWVAATAAKLAFTPATQPIQGISVAAPDFAFVAIQSAALLLHAAFGLLVALYLGGIAGQLGAERRRPFVLPARRAAHPTPADPPIA